MTTPEQLARIIGDEFERQVQDGKYPIGGYVNADELLNASIDGHFDLVALANVIITNTP
jgi:hypothetical protein